MRKARITDSRTPSRGSLPFSEIRYADRSRDGLPHRHHPFSEFLTLSAVCSQHTLAALFHAASARRLSTSRAFPTRASRDASRRPMLSCHWTRAFVGDLRAWQHNPSANNSCASPDFRALLRPGVRHFIRQWSGARSRCSPGLSSSPRLANSLTDPKRVRPSCTCLQIEAAVAHKHPPAPCTTGY
jgi:hypothetical protein